MLWRGGGGVEWHTCFCVVCAQSALGYDGGSSNAVVVTVKGGGGSGCYARCSVCMHVCVKTCV